MTVDDQANWRELIKAILEEDGCDVLTATSYSQAAEIIEAWEFDLVILDVRLDDLQTYNVQGIQLLRRLKEQLLLTGAIVLTGYPNSMHRDRCLNLYKADAYEEKVPQWV